mgnify:CR=1 FL=1
MNNIIKDKERTFTMSNCGGGLLNLCSYGTSNILVYGNPEKSVFFKTYKSITNFGIQRFRLDAKTPSTPSITDSITMEYVLDRNAEMVGDCYLVVNLPDVYSPIYKYRTGGGSNVYYAPEFRWIDELGVNIIREVEVQSGGQTISRYTGEYFSILAHRDNRHKLDLWKQMVGHVDELTNPKKECVEIYDNIYKYPNALYDTDLEQISGNIEPSIRGRKLYVPLDMWFTRKISDALPLVATQYAPITIRIQLRPLKEWYVVREKPDLLNEEYVKGVYMSPDSSTYEHQPHRFFNPPQSEPMAPKGQTDEMHRDIKLNWKSDIHVMATYYFLSEEERGIMANRVYKRLIRDVYNHTLTDIVGPTQRRVYSSGLVSSYTFRFRRNDSDKRNEWSNYTNQSRYNYVNKCFSYLPEEEGLSAFESDLYHSGGLENENQKKILKTFNIVVDGIERENTMDAGIVEYVETYARSAFLTKQGVYEYNFTCDTNTRNYQPGGGMNMDKFGEVMFHIDTITPPLKDVPDDDNICNDLFEIVGSRKRNANLYQYTYEMEVFEERYNTLTIRSGNIGLLFAR